MDIPGYKSPSTITGDCFRPDLLLSFSNKCLYIVELTVGYETNLEKNAKRKKAKYSELVIDQSDHIEKVNFVNISMSSLGVYEERMFGFYQLA